VPVAHGSPQPTPNHRSTSRRSPSKALQIRDHPCASHPLQIRDLTVENPRPATATYHINYVATDSHPHVPLGSSIIRAVVVHGAFGFCRGAAFFFVLLQRT